MSNCCNKCIVCYLKDVGLNKKRDGPVLTAEVFYLWIVQKVEMSVFHAAMESHGLIKNNKLRSSSTATSYLHDGLTFLTAQPYYHNLENVFYPPSILQPL